MPPDPSGSDTMPSKVMNSMTMTLTMVFPSVDARRYVLAAPPGLIAPDSFHRAHLTERNLFGQVERANTAGSWNTTLCVTRPG